MKTQRNVYEMNDIELKRVGRVLRLRMERRRKCLILAAAVLTTLCVILICSVSYNAISSRASDGFKYYTSVTVEVGETLWDLAGNYMDGHYDSRESYMAEVCSINHLSSVNDITAGQTLIVPYYSDEFIK